MLMYVAGLEETWLSLWVVQLDLHVFMILLLGLLDAVPRLRLAQTLSLVQMDYTRLVSIIIVLDMLRILSLLTMVCYHGKWKSPRLCNELPNKSTVLQIQTVTKSIIHKTTFNLDAAHQRQTLLQLPPFPVKLQTLTYKLYILESPSIQQSQYKILVILELQLCSQLLRLEV